MPIEAGHKTAVFHRSTKACPPIAEGGEGCYLIDAQGKRYLDGSGGAAVSCLGHNHREVIAAIQNQAAKLSYAHSSFFTSQPTEELAAFLVKKSQPHFSNVYFVSGGSEAVEAAIKMACQFYVESGKPSKHRVIGRRQSYHGNTLGALSVGGNMWRRTLFAPLLLEAHHISPCYAYRYKKEDESIEQYGLRVSQELEDKILELGPETVAAFIAEPVVGATMGCVPAVKGYFQQIRSICKKYDVLLILDEVMCGMGRTGSMFAYEQEGISADLVTLAKGLGGGYLPIGAVMVSPTIYSAIQQGSGFFQHGHTYIGHALACAASLKVQQIIERDNLLDHIVKMGDLLKTTLKQQLEGHPLVGDIRGRGLFVGIELVQDRKTKAPFSSEHAIHARVKRLAFEDGLLCYPMGGTIDGKSGDHILLAPPYIVSDSQIDEIAGKLSAAIQQATTGL